MNKAVMPVAGDSLTDRILVIDILRGFALFGIIVNHITVGYLAGPPPPGNEQFNIQSPVDGVANLLSMILTFGKFFTIFSFLFGISFAIMLKNAAAKGTSLTLRFLWRLLLLFVIGFVHNMFYSGDILVVYAMLGVLLLPARFLGNNLLLVLALLLTCNVPGLVQDIVRVAGASGEQQAGGPNPFGAIAAAQFGIKQSGSLGEVIRMNALDGLQQKFIFQLMSSRLWITFGLFLLGMYAGRKHIFVYSEANRRSFKRLLLWSGITGVISLVLAITLGNPFGGASSWPQVLGNLAFGIHQAAFAAFYVSAVVLLYWKAAQTSMLRHLAAVGKIGLSTYLIQSVFGLLLFYGFGLGLLGRLGATASIAIGIAFFVLQVVFARWWTRRFQFGLVEWAWRSLTFLEVQPLVRRRPTEQAAIPAGTVVVVDSVARETSG